MLESTLQKVKNECSWHVFSFFNLLNMWKLLHVGDDLLNCFVELQMLMTQTSNLNSPLGASGVHSPTQLREQAGSDILDSDVEKIQLDKSNILLLGPTGSG